MKLKNNIDKAIQSELDKFNLTYEITSSGQLYIAEYRLDLKAKAGMLYLKPHADVPAGELPFRGLSTPHLFGVFFEKNEALIIKVISLGAIEGELKDFYRQ